MKLIKESVTLSNKNASRLKESRLSLKEGSDVNASALAIAKFIERAVDGLKKDPVGCYKFNLNRNLAIYVGYSAGYGNEIRDDVIQDPNDPDWAINAGVKVSTSDYMQTDYDYLNFPYFENGEVWDAGVSLTTDEDYKSTATWLLDQFNEMLKYNIDDDGLIHEKSAEDDDIDESCKRETAKKSLKEEVSDEAYQVADIINNKFADKEFISRDDFDKALNNAFYEVFGGWFFNDEETMPTGETYNDFEIDVRGCLSFEGWETIFEGEDEGGLRKVSDLNESKLLKESASDFFDVKQDIVSRARDYMEEGNSIEDSINYALGEGMIYYVDQWAVIEEYLSPDDVINGQSIYAVAEESFYSDVYSALTENTNESVKSRKDLTEGYHASGFDKLPDGTKVSAVGTTRSTRNYTYEDVEFKFGNKIGNGTYRWMNRPWQRFDFAEALREAMIEVGIDQVFAGECIQNAYTLEMAIEYFAENYNNGTQPTDETEKLTESPVYNLGTQFDKRQSFYGKARVDDNGDVKTLYSYNTPVCKIENGKVILLPAWDYSMTTVRHVKEFLQQNSFQAVTKNQISKDYTHADK